MFWHPCTVGVLVRLSWGEFLDFANVFARVIRVGVLLSRFAVDRGYDW